MLKRWKTQKSERVFHCKWYDVVKNDVELPTKEMIEYYVVDTTPSVFIVPVTEENEIIFARQYRYPIDEFSLELPAGNTDGQEQEKAARRELEEETGYRTKKLEYLGDFIPYNGVGSEKCFVYLAKELSMYKAKPEKSEFFEIFKIPIKKAYEMAENNEIKDGMTLSSLMLAKKKILKD
jgi:ADP-ribose pyrophosphatase